MSEGALTTRIPLVERVLEANDEVAAGNRAELERRGIFSIDLIGAPGSGKTALLEANQVRDALAQIELDAVDLLFIENVGNLICPVGFDLGQASKVGLFSLTEGDDKAAKHPYLVEAAKMFFFAHISFRILGHTVTLTSPRCALWSSSIWVRDWPMPPPIERGVAPLMIPLW